MDRRQTIFRTGESIRRAEARTKEREKLLTKAKGKAKEDKSEDKKGGANEARAAFSRAHLRPPTASELSIARTAKSRPTKPVETKT